jgi:hypothetical protein
LKPANRRAVGVALVAVALLAAGCRPVGSGEDPCAPGGCQVPIRPSDAPAAVSAPLYVPQCHDVDPGHTPACVDQVGDSGMWIFTPEGSAWPEGVAVTLCPTEDGGPDGPCVWLPSIQGQHPTTGDAGAYVFGVKN